MSKRLQKEYDNLKNLEKTFIEKQGVKQKAYFPFTLKPIDNLYNWKVRILGPKDTPYYNAIFYLRYTIPKTYPHHAIKAKFITKICHPNIDYRTGEICLDILKDQWSPIWTLESITRAIILLLSNPEASSPLNCDAGNLIRAGDMIGYYNLAKMYVYEHCELVPEEGKAEKAEEGKERRINQVKKRRINQVKNQNSKNKFNKYIYFKMVM